MISEIPNGTLNKLRKYQTLSGNKANKPFRLGTKLSGINKSIKIGMNSVVT